MRRIVSLLSVITITFILVGIVAQTAFAEEGSGMSTSFKDKKILVVYFSHTGNTRNIANQIHERTGGDIVEIKTVIPYTNDYDSLVEQAKKELASGFNPELQTKVGNFESYDVIFIGYPIWCGTFPAPVKTFLLSYDFSGKVIVPFCTHGGGGPGQSVTNLKAICPDSTFLEGLVVRGSTVKDARAEVLEWLQ